MKYLIKQYSSTYKKLDRKSSQCAKCRNDKDHTQPIANLNNNLESFISSKYNEEKEIKIKSCLKLDQSSLIQINQ